MSVGLMHSADSAPHVLDMVDQIGTSEAVFGGACRWTIHVVRVDVVVIVECEYARILVGEAVSGVKLAVALVLQSTVPMRRRRRRRPVKVGCTDRRRPGEMPLFWAAPVRCRDRDGVSASSRRGRQRRVMRSARVDRRLRSRIALVRHVIAVHSQSSLASLPARRPYPRPPLSVPELVEIEVEAARRRGTPSRRGDRIRLV